jgi:hypothetical protein
MLTRFFIMDCKYITGRYTKFYFNPGLKLFELDISIFVIYCETLYYLTTKINLIVECLLELHKDSKTKSKCSIIGSISIYLLMGLLHLKINMKIYPSKNSLPAQLLFPVSSLGRTFIKKLLL